MRNFYREFENKYRGSHEVIVDRMRFYIPLLDELYKQNPEVSVLDLGCGRGEWLELVRSRGWKNLLGVDSNPHMLSAAEDYGIPVVNDDALKYLAAQKDSSFDLITAFHFVEHIDFALLQELTNQCYRVLKPGGVLIYETPNAENIMVGTNNFYLDPTHSKPIPALLLEFLVNYSGFGVTNIARLQHKKEYDSQESISLLDVISGVSMDYVILACKAQPNEISDSLREIFTAKYGYNLKYMLDKYDGYLRNEIDTLTECDGYLRKEIGTLTESVEKLKKNQEEHFLSMEKSKEEYFIIFEKIKEETELLKEQNEIIRRELNDIYQSKLWRLKSRISNLLFFGLKITTLEYFNHNANNVMHSKFARRSFRHLQRIAPRFADKLRKIISKEIVKKSIKSLDRNKKINRVDSIFLKDTYLSQINFINKFNSINNELYICYLESMINSDKLDSLFMNFKPEIKYWFLTLNKMKEIDVNLIESILPENVTDIDIGYALYMVLLGRLPNSVEEVKYPVRHLARVIINSREYSNFCGAKLNAWFNS